MPVAAGILARRLPAVQPRAYCVTSLSLKNEENKTVYVLAILWGLKEITHVKCGAQGRAQRDRSIQPAPATITPGGGSITFGAPRPRSRTSQC